MRLLLAQKKLFSSTRPIKNFTHLETLQAEDLNLQITRLLHQKSGAMIYNVKSSDKDNTFAPIVKTLPENDKGCPHILQHLACCGSHRFPTRDPFFNMLKRSVNTYMNAWTGEDFTAYPFSSANGKDFDNLYRVYLDMCLKPLLNELDFRQEGWRYELSPQTAQKQIKGIVFNEMKGAYQNPDRQLSIEVATRLFASTPYSYDSGGKPDSIVKLSYEEVQNMHRYYYHPSNMAFYYYGDGDIGGKLEYLEKEYLDRYGYSNQVGEYITKGNKLMQGMPTKIDKVFHRVSSYTAETPNVALAYNLGLLADTDGVDVTCLNILSYLLLETNQAQLYQQFIEAGLADSFGQSGFNLSSLLSFSVTLKNVKISEQEVLARVEKCIGKIIEKGVNSRRVEEYVRQTELEILTPKQTQGINYLGNCIPYMINRMPLHNLTQIRSNLNAAVSKLKDKEQLRGLLSKYFLNNGRKVVVRQQPIESKGEEQYKGIIGLDFAQELIRKQQEELKDWQDSKQNSAECLPKLSLADLEPSVAKDYQVKAEGVTGQKMGIKDIHVKIDIKDINFVRVVFKLDMAKEENAKLLSYLDLWVYTMRQGIAAGGLTNKQMSSQLALSSNNFTVQIEKSSSESPTHMNVVFSASCLGQHLPTYIALLHKLVFQPEFKQEDLGNIFRSYKAEKVEELLDGGVMQYCLDYGSAFLSQQGRVFDKYAMVTEGLRVAAKGEVPQEFGLLHARFREAADVTIIQHSKQYVKDIAKHLGFDLKLSSSSNASAKGKSQPKPQSQPASSQIAVTNAYDVNFCSQQYPGPSFYSRDHAQLTLLVELLEQDYLHQKIREKGGAYGARAIIRDVGTVALYSYMDPYSTQTYGAFEESVAEVLASSVSKEKLEELKIKVIGGLETPIVPQRECVNRILKDYTNEERNRFIQYIRDSEWPEVLETGKKYLQGTVKSRVMFGKEVPKGFTEEKLKIPKQEKAEEDEGNTSEAQANI